MVRIGVTLQSTQPQPLLWAGLPPTSSGCPGPTQPGHISRDGAPTALGSSARSHCPLSEALPPHIQPKSPLIELKIIPEPYPTCMDSRARMGYIPESRLLLKSIHPLLLPQQPAHWHRAAAHLAAHDGSQKEPPPRAATWGSAMQGHDRWSQRGAVVPPAKTNGKK